MAVNKVRINEFHGLYDIFLVKSMKIFSAAIGNWQNWITFPFCRAWACTYGKMKKIHFPLFHPLNASINTLYILYKNKHKIQR
jgi:hypothetical protein